MIVGVLVELGARDVDLKVLTAAELHLVQKGYYAQTFLRLDGENSIPL